MGKLIRFRKKRAGGDESARPLFPPFQAGSDARPANYPSDAATNEEKTRPGDVPDPVVIRKKLRRKQGAVLALIATFLAGSAAALFGVHGYFDVERQRRRLADLKVSNDAHQQRVDALIREIDRLKTDPAAVERIAREDLGYVAPGEITLLLPKDDAEDKPGLDAHPESAIVPGASRSRTP